MFTFGLDVSHWTGKIDWLVAQRWIPFVYFKCTDGTRHVDATYHDNHQGCFDVGMPHAPYHWYQPDQDPIKQAAHFVDVAGKDFKRYIVDVEQVPKNTRYLSSVDLRVHLDQLELLTGVRPAIYTGAGFWNDYVKPRPGWAKKFDLIVAHYTHQHSPMLPVGWTEWKMWQFSDRFFFPGALSHGDANWFKGTLDEARDWFGNYHEFIPPVYNATRLRSQFDNLHVRLNPTVTSKELGHLQRDQEVEVLDLGGKDAWVRHAEGWTAIEIDGYRYMEVVK